MGVAGMGKQDMERLLRQLCLDSVFRAGLSYAADFSTTMS